MAILYSEVKYYTSLDIDFVDNTLNGGDKGVQIVNDTLHSIFPEISATQREDGIILRAKIFIENDSVDRKMQDAVFYIKQDVQPDDKLRMYAATTLVNHEDEEDFVLGKKFINSVIKSTVSAGITTISIPIQDKDLYEIGDNIVIVDSYFRASFRGEVNDIQDHSTDVETAVITLSKEYASANTISALTGYVANGLKQTLVPADTFAIWMELEISSSSAIDSEIVNQFQIGVHFDDVAV